MEGYRERVRGTLLGGAVGDALGWPVEFLQLPQIHEQYGPAGVTGFRPSEHRGYRDKPADRPGDVTDDTQMTLFSAEGLIRARLAGGPEGVGPALHAAYQRWFLTQQQNAPDAGPRPAPYDGWLLRQPFLYARRAPGRACWSGLQDNPGYRAPVPFGQPGPINSNSKGCGTVMRSAPFGLLRLGPLWSFELAGRCAQITHGHPTGYLAAGAFAALVDRLTSGQPLRAAVEQTLAQVAQWPQGEETAIALRRALALAAEEPSEQVVERVGLGWIAEECLAIAVYAALVAERVGVRRALLLSVNHSGDSDSVGAVCGNLLGAAYGLAGLPGEWVAAVEGRDVALRVADDLVDLFAGAGTELEGRYPAG
ncbi:ADP-ribosylglycohydrolase [Kitasatospora sp. MAA4]|uniref:ADP-ribosylglycohydrolase family protein n=1 Tax=Kitasatospora sp. MAA4 TaxID=3035093 RepID=UPI002474E670|nr:ADP-ribosylglycohydrolase family protein [Kitasatospora sp. MAA4]MDH6136551.1 ADP-ribosylglycohydrolase [Kitasatospora sp. MAA4]